MKVTPKQALDMLSQKSSEFETVFEHGSLSVEIYKPEQLDLQEPHQRDEVYIIISGVGEFVRTGERMQFGPWRFSIRARPYGTSI